MTRKELSFNRKKLSAEADSGRDGLGVRGERGVQGELRETGRNSDYEAEKIQLNVMQQ